MPGVPGNTEHRMVLFKATDSRSEVSPSREWLLTVATTANTSLRLRPSKPRLAMPMPVAVAREEAMAVDSDAESSCSDSIS